MLRYYLQVFGWVQGVGFRYTAAQLAKAQHAHGRPHPDHVLGRLSERRGRRVSELAFTIARLGFLGFKFSYFRRDVNWLIHHRPPCLYC